MSWTGKVVAVGVFILAATVIWFTNLGKPSLRS